MQDSKTYLNVPYAQKDTAKELGAKWNPAKKQWYVPADKDISLFAEWQVKPGTSTETATKTQSKSRTIIKNVVLGVTTYGKNKNLRACTEDSPPWD